MDKATKAQLKAVKVAIRDDQLDEAQELLQEILAESPDHYQALVFRGAVFKKQNQAAKAEDSYRQAIQTNSEELLAWHGLVDLLEAAVAERPGREEELIQAYEQILAIAGLEAEVRAGRVVLRLLQLYENEGYWFKAAELCASLVADDGTAVLAPTEEGTSWPSQAISFFDRQVEVLVEKDRRATKHSPEQAQLAIIVDIKASTRQAVTKAWRVLLAAQPSASIATALATFSWRFHLVHNDDLAPGLEHLPAASQTAFRTAAHYLHAQPVPEVWFATDHAFKGVVHSRAIEMAFDCRRLPRRQPAVSSSIPLVPCPLSLLTDRDCRFVTRTCNTRQQMGLRTYLVTWRPASPKVRSLQSHAARHRVPMVGLTAHLAINAAHRAMVEATEPGVLLAQGAVLDNISSLHLTPIALALRAQLAFWMGDLTLACQTAENGQQELHCLQDLCSNPSLGQGIECLLRMTCLQCEWRLDSLAHQRVERDLHALATAHGALERIVLLELAQLDVTRDLTRDAIEKLQQVQAHEDGTPQILHLRALVREREQQRAEALADAEAAVKQGHPRLERYLLLGRLQRRAGQTGQSRATLVLAARLNPTHADIFFELGQTLEASQDTERAAQCYAKTVQLDLVHEPAGEALWRLYQQMGRHADASQLVERVSLAPSADRVRWVWIRLGQLRLQQHRASDAVSALQKALRNNRSEANIWRLLGRAYFERGSYASALKALGRAFELNNTDVAARTTMGKVQLQLGEHAEALSIFDEALQLDPAYAPAIEGYLLTQLDVIRHDIGQGLLHAAAQACAQGLSLFVSRIEAVQSLVCIWKTVADLLAASFYFPPKHQTVLGEAQAALAHVFQLENTPEPLELATRAYVLCVERDPQSSSSWADLAGCLTRRALLAQDLSNEPASQALLSEALCAIQQSLVLDPADGESWELAGFIGLHTRVFPFAERAFAKAAELRAADGGAWVGLGALYLMQHDLPRANQALSRAQANDPGLARAWIGQALVAAQFVSSEMLDLLRHAFELFAHPLASLGFAWRVLAAVLPQSDEMALQAFAQPGLQFGAFGHVPDGETSHYCQQALVAIERFSASRSGHQLPVAWALQGLLSEQVGLFEAAVEAWECCVNLLMSAPQQNEAQLQVAVSGLARALCHAGQSTRGLELYQHVDRPGLFDRLLAGEAYLHAGRYSEAFQARDAHTTALSDGQADCFSLHIAAVLGVVAFANQELDLSKQLLFEAVARPELCPPAVLIMGALGVISDDPDLTEAALGEIPRLRQSGALNTPELVESYYRLRAYAHLARGDTRGARRAISQLLRTYPQLAANWVLLSKLVNGDSGADTSQGLVDGPCAAPRNMAQVLCQGALNLTRATLVRSSGAQTSPQTSTHGLAASIYTTLAASQMAHPDAQLWSDGDLAQYRVRVRRAALRAVHVAPHDFASWLQLACALAAHAMLGVEHQQQCLVATERAISLMETTLSTLSMDLLHQPRRDALMRSRLWAMACRAFAQLRLAAQATPTSKLLLQAVVRSLGVLTLPNASRRY
ncbi:uncharacterized protein MONBRDRAFT_7095 [Monosiga brevicollis MX1]|uniref:Tetratricopeptide repeat protein 37 n=1 Tax=Monosiga brevicollis TaxID=81824 RepID=A9UVW9_MONBE|nr:uncharacterized protein MONBRDRAFT_7095 [Monosiga brevicollis MX1]EDQ90463.1 predicted protein [Monosiga brevicollis MX1]|eukprot:XP_001744514.1 hypothetical protein [Monosiga brevicollis MX1]